ncbi:ectoine hydroxylase-related dioxygenase (phytanoyl-CoA dioxygenase family) [Paenibacillus taihuensis]|uniref:Ectoine hydroxylase-related dioxygenase (Phytanoyl-CoA dioxygenase family) n=1 Tax=Paenibacillus taihuensis TaxID=1156355 RepID=A0A3D9S7H2_9BACL|nr:phytanoyl-CoA dioxygenase family protein [Paenibacillus taihuensis]REE85291.1 ectoine hydroxylase-related dioxygenase (phytanoyl-CoA dioxygenase family) [Paenibacillus taihuensis]
MGHGTSEVRTPQEINVELYPQNNICDTVLQEADVQAEQVQFYRQQGYIGVSSILSEAEIASALDAIVEHIFDDETKVKVQFVKPRAELHSDEERELAVRKLSEFADVDARLRAIAYHPVLLSLVERLLGTKPKLVQDQALLKPPKGGGEKPWHQDMAYGNLAYDQPVIGVWIALDEAGLHNGCMQLIPRSHMDGGTPHYAVRDWQLCDAAVPVERNVAVPLAPGSALFFHGLLAHGTAFNISEHRRRALQFHYAPETAEKIGPKEYKRMFTSEMTGADC